MKKFTFLFILLLHPIVNFAQSRAGFINAGDECMAKNDGFSAIGYYEQAAAYSEDAGLFLKTAIASGVTEPSTRTDSISAPLSSRIAAHSG
mgnify:CR=1 FL=1